MATFILKTVLLIFVLTALSVTLTMRSINPDQQTTESVTSTYDHHLPNPSKRVSRFLKETTAVDGIPGLGGNNGNGVGGGGIKNPRAADHCSKDPGLCKSLYGDGFECCNNKCLNLNADKHNCGGCKNKCEFKDECCNGKCVFLALDKRHCGKCDSACSAGEFCLYGLCNYP
ncbi:Stigma-specific STIG1-like protein 3 [Linum grandiflorum]